MKRLLPYCLFLLSSIWFPGLSAQTFTSPPEEMAMRKAEFLLNGQPIMLVMFKFQDSRGFVWGTGKDRTPARYDGHKFDLFFHDPTDSTTFSDASIYGPNAKFMEDHAGRIWILYSTNECLDYFDPKTEQFHRMQKRLQKATGKGKTGFILDVFEDRQHRIWIGSEHGVFQYLPETDSLRHFRGTGIVTLIFEDRDGNIWMNVLDQHQNRRLGKLNVKSGAIEEWVDLPLVLPEIKRKWIDYAYPWEADPSILLLIEQKLFQFNPRTRKVTFLQKEVWDQNEVIHSLCGNADSVFFVTDYAKLGLLTPGQPTVKELYSWQKENEPAGLHFLTNLFRSEDGIVWMMVEHGYPENPSVEQFQFLPKRIRFQATPRPVSIPLLKLNEDYIVELGGQVYFFTPPSLQPIRPGVPAGPVLDLAIAGLTDPWALRYHFQSDSTGGLWIVAFGKGPLHVRKFNAGGELVYAYDAFPDRDKTGAFPGGTPQDLDVDQNGKLWMPTWGSGLVWFDPASRTFGRYGEDILNRDYSNVVMVDRANRVWVGTSLWLSCLDQRTGQWNHYHPDNSGLLGESLSLFQDRKGHIWVGTRSGLFRWEEEQRDFAYFGLEKGLPLDGYLRIFEDHLGQMWVIGSNEMFLYDENRDLFLTFSGDEGATFGIGMYYGYHADREGYVFLSTSNARGHICYFNSEKIDLNPDPPAIHFTDLFLFNKKVKPLAEDGILPMGLDFVKNIQFRFDQNDFAVHFTAPEYTHPEKLRFFIKMEGFHKEWQDLGNTREARFTGLPPGDYTLQVKVRDRFFFESEIPRTLQITILPPWYRTNLAYALWIVLFLGTIYIVYRYQLRRRLAIAEAERLKALDLAKTQLYTNITHEFRTPLTIILGMADQVKSDPKNWFNEGLGLIRRNGKQLLNLVNQMLDLSKLESGHMRLNLVQGDIIGYLRYLIESFHSYADSKDIRLHFASDFKELYMDFDPEKMQHIFSNLLSNAIKFTQAGGDVYIECSVLNVQFSVKEEETLQIKVRDNGRGIAPEHLPHIFDRFYQVDPSATRRGEGTGIGLALTKELVKLMGGRIEVESELDKGAQFSIRLPVTRMAEPTTTTPEEAAIGDVIQLERPFTPAEPEVPPGDQPLVLLIEDNADVITYLRSFLGGEYQIITATNGQEGIDKALEHIPDLVVSDVMMPEKDGFEVCATLKTDERSSHIPVILLTAKSDDASRLEGLTHGADAYLAKPFNKEELLVRIEKLIELRRRLQAHYQRAGELVQLKGKPDPTPEDRFLQKLVAIVEENLSDENFGLPDLCRKAGLSRSQLFRKVKALTGKPTTHFIRSIRLARAKELLETTGMSVSEVAFAVGFSWLNYFSKVFREEFGVMPSEVRGK